MRIIGAAALALVARVLVLQRGGIVVEHQALLASQRDEAAALGEADQREARLLRQRDAPGGEAGARYQDGNAHLHRLDHPLRGQPPGGVRSEEHTSELQSLMRISYALFCLKKNK